MKLKSQSPSDRRVTDVPRETPCIRVQARRGGSGYASEMRRKRREEGGELIESEQRISGMAYSSFGSLLLFFFLPAYLSSLTIPRLGPPPRLLAPSFAAPCTLFGQGTKEDRWKDAKEVPKREKEREREKEAFLCLCAHGSRSYIAYNVQRQKRVQTRDMRVHARVATHERCTYTCAFKGSCRDIPSGHPEAVLVSDDILGMSYVRVNSICLAYVIPTATIIIREIG